jgi:hypothetical protein
LETDFEKSETKQSKTLRERQQEGCPLSKGKTMFLPHIWGQFYFLADERGIEGEGIQC